MTRRAFDRTMHGYRVTLGHGGPAGVLNHCLSKTTLRRYWKVKLDSGAWVWPDDVVAESEGPCVARCVECELEYRGATPQSGGLCPNCAHALLARERPDHDPDADPSHQFGRARWRREHSK
jgi:DNA-directed RNA polymerase subunit RPC12/RpoP